MKKLFLSLLLLIVAYQFSQAQNPEVPSIEMVTINANGNPEITWSVTDPTIIDGYIIVRQIWDSPGTIDGTYHDIDTLYGGDQNHYIDQTTLYGLPQPDTRAETYRLKSFRIVDGAYVLSPSMSEPHSHILLLEPEFNLCAQEVTLTWTSYIGWGGRLRSYIV